MARLKRLSVIGLGKLGACMAASFAQRGFDVLGVDINEGLVAKINAGETPFEEPLLARTIARGRSLLRASCDPTDALDTDASFFVVPSPSLSDGSFSNDYLLKAMRPLARAIKAARKRGHLFVVSSTTTPGACREVIIPMVERDSGGVCGRDFGFCYNPEFVALGNIVRGLLEPDLILIGESDTRSGGRLAELYKRYNLNSPKIARMSVTSAEMAKIAINSYITTKISFTNQLRMIAGRYSDTDIHEILGAVGADSRIGHKYLRAGVSYGGPCFPRDNRLLAFAAKRAGLSAPLAEAADRVNELAREHLTRQVIECTKRGDTIAVLGMAYRPDTHIVEGSAGLHLATALMRRGRRVLVHDFAANVKNCPNLLKFETLADLAGLKTDKRVKVVLICSPASGYRKIHIHKGANVFDPWGVLEKEGTTKHTKHTKF